MKIKKFFIVALDTDKEVVGVVTQTAGGHMMVPATQFIADQDTPYFWGPQQTEMLEFGMRHYHEMFFGETIPAARARYRSRISERPWTIEVREAEINL